MIKKIIYILIFILAIFLVIKGNTIQGYKGLSIMFIGLACLLAELYSYNRKYQYRGGSIYETNIVNNGSWIRK